MNKPDNKEFQNFDKAMQELIKVPHSRIKAKLDAEKKNSKRGGAVPGT
jgi:hypothetical protein